MGNLRHARSYAERVLKVVHSGEHGAVNIYRGQIIGARLSCPAYRPELIEFQRHEERHRAIFAAELAGRGVRRCRSYAMCGFGGLMLGLVTGVFGRRVIAVTTVAVERVVLKHLAEYRARLAGEDRAAHHALTQIVDDEQQHHDETAAQAGEPGVVMRWLASIVSGSTEVVIWTGMRV